MSDKQYLELTRAGGNVVRLTRSAFQGKERIDLRVHFTTEDGKTLPTKKGINLSVRDVPALRAALDRADTDALEADWLGERMLCAVLDTLLCPAHPHPREERSCARLPTIAALSMALAAQTRCCTMMTLSQQSG
jgi:hypothetical protein